MSAREPNTWIPLLRGLWPLFVVIALSVAVLFVVTPEMLVEAVGIENAYVLMMLTAFLGGATTFNTVPYLSLLLLLASGGLNPYILGLVSALGVMGGDTLSYLIGFHGNRAVPTFLRSFFERIHTWASTHPRHVPLMCFLYGACCPLSNDLIMIPAGMARIPYWRIMVPLACGNILFNIGLALSAAALYDALLWW